MNVLQKGRGYSAPCKYNEIIISTAPIENERDGNEAVVIDSIIVKKTGVVKLARVISCGECRANSK